MSTTPVSIAASEDVPEGGRIVVEVDGVEVGVFRLDGELFAWQNYCAHVGGPICQGMMIPKVVELLDEHRRSRGDAFGDAMHIVCPWHGYEFDIRTGEHPADAGIRLVPHAVRESDGEILVDF